VNVLSSKGLKIILKKAAKHY